MQALNEIDERGQAAIEELLAVMGDEFTGSVEVHFRDGTPHRVKRIRTRDLSNGGLDRNRDEPYR